MHEPTPRWNDADYEALETVLREQSGLILQPLHRPAVETAANCVMQRIGTSEPSRLLSLVEQNGVVFDDLIAEVANGETHFFREQAHFTLLRDTIIPAFRERQSEGQRFRAWSAGCSTGEEPYSIALALHEEGVPARVVGTDISRPRLNAARRGEYRRWSFRGVPEPLIDRHFVRSDDRFTLCEVVRRDVEFRYLNLAADCFPSMTAGVWGMDVIFCRNVLVYFDDDSIARVGKALLASLAADGCLLLGAADPPIEDYVRCRAEHTEAGVVYRPLRGTAARSPIARPTERTPGRLPALLPAVATHAPEPITAEDAYAARDYERAAALSLPTGNGRADLDRLLLHIRALSNLGRIDEAGRTCAAALDEFRDVAELHYLHAVLAGRAGRPAESARAARRAIHLDQTMVVAHLALGNALADAGESAGALRAFAVSERLLATLPPDAVVPGTDCELAGRLLESTRLRAALVNREDAA